MLTVTLRQLERDGLCAGGCTPLSGARRVLAHPLGATLHAMSQSLITWTQEHQRELAAARSAHDARAGAAPQRATARL
jgi:DNA-binding HxlR family transcriptional regulator